MNQFTVQCTSDKIWNQGKLLNFLLLNQHKQIELRLQPEAICLRNLGLYDLLDQFSFLSVNIRTWNPLESHDVYNIIFIGDNFWFKKIENIDHSLHGWNKNKIFYCLFGRPTASRLGLAAHLYTNHKEKSHIHFSTAPSDDNLDQFELDKLLHYDINSIESAGKLIVDMPVLLSEPDLYTPVNGYNYQDPLTNLYKDILIDVFSESHVAGTTFFPTEKTTRPMWLKKPFIVFASRDYLCYLRQMGFRTFGDFWNEDYDGYEGKDRYIRILKLIDEIASMSAIELENIYYDMSYTLDHNYNLLMSQTYKNQITSIIQ